MNEIVQKEEIVRIINDKLVIDTGTDWIAIFALCFSIISTIGILCWQNYLRKKDKKEQVKIRENDKKEERQRIAKEDKVRKWNALYPYRIKFYTEFYDALFRFLNVCDKAKSHSYLAENIKNQKENLQEYRSLFNKFTEDAKILFDEYIQSRVRCVYDEIDIFLNDIMVETIDNLDVLVKIDKQENVQYHLSKKIKVLIQNIKDLKLDTDLRQKFEQILTMKGNEDE